MQGMDRMLNEWLVNRERLAAIERAEHRDVIDRHGRVWAWVSGTLYRHCGMAWPLESIQNPGNGLPCESVRTNPNYDLCAICRGESLEGDFDSHLREDCPNRGICTRHAII